MRQARAEAASILRNEDDRLIIIVGPCSIHDTQAAKEYSKFYIDRPDHLGKLVSNATFCFLQAGYFFKLRRNIAENS